MNNLGDIINEFLVRNQTSTAVAFYTDAILTRWADLAHKQAAGYKKWPFTEGRVSTTYASLVTNDEGLLRGEYPEGWKSDSLRYLSIGGKKLEKKSFTKFRKYVEDNPGNTDRIFTDYGRQYFINPTADVSGTVTVWGQYTPALLDPSDPSVTTVFSGEEEGNEAIVEFMQSYARKREKNLGESIAHQKEGMRILEQLFERFKEEQFGYQATDDEGIFKRMDVLNGSFRDDLKEDQFN